MSTPPQRRGPVPTISPPRQAVPRNRFGLPDVDAIYAEIQRTADEARQAQEKIIVKLNQILERLPPQIPPGVQGA
jgi:hypothetical protein